MKKVFLLVSIILCCVFAKAQKYYDRTVGLTTPNDPHFSASKSLKIPNYNDTSSALTGAGIDSIGLIFHQIATGSLWIRESHKWEAIGLPDTLFFVPKGSSGDTLLKVTPDSVYFPLIRDSLGSHHVINPDGSWTFYSSGGNSYIQNQTASAQTAAFWINGSSRIDNSLFVNNTGPEALIVQDGLTGHPGITFQRGSIEEAAIYTEPPSGGSDSDMVIGGWGASRTGFGFRAVRVNLTDGAFSIEQPYDSSFFNIRDERVSTSNKRYFLTFFPHTLTDSFAYVQVTTGGKLLLGTADSTGSYRIKVNGNAYISDTIAWVNPILNGTLTNDSSVYYNTATGQLEIGTKGSGGGGGSTSPGTPTTSVQYNSSGSFAGSSNFEWDNTNHIVTVTTPTSANTVYPAFEGLNSGTATSSNVMYGGAFYSIGQGFQSSSKEVGFRQYTLPNSGGMGISGSYVWDGNLNNGSWATLMTLTSSGTLIPTNLNTSGNVTASGTVNAGTLLSNGTNSLLSGTTSLAAIKYLYVQKSASYSLTSSDYIVEFTGSSGETATLPSATTNQFLFYIIKNEGTGTVTLATTSGQTIDGSSPGTLSQGQFIQLESDGSNWFTTASSVTAASTPTLDQVLTAGSSSTQSATVGSLTTGHLIFQGTAPTTSNLGTNVSSATISGHDGALQLTITTSGNASGTLCSINYNSAFASTPFCVIIPADAGTGGNITYIIANGTNTTTALVAGNITGGAGTYKFTVISVDH